MLPKVITSTRIKENTTNKVAWILFDVFILFEFLKWLNYLFFDTQRYNHMQHLERFFITYKPNFVTDITIQLHIL